jgi:hypothetical protein
MVTYIDDHVARRRTCLECYRSILADERFFVTESASKIILGKAYLTPLFSLMRWVLHLEHPFS